MIPEKWKEPVAVICGLLAAMGGITGIALTFKYGNALLALCGILELALAGIVCVRLWKEGE